ncbi:hypothetical protein QYE76_053982 [Lolium multiflorum]|uniref:GH10 domain-containing protein n=1 Tax=Lolium multiflorum TaxID=4521 RepID=A0AAD8SYK2_LOLMU|nr:hypothetical protein QYE76_053982 [Lolium multiflorum]
MRVHKIGHMSGRFDPTRTSKVELSKAQVARRVNNVTKANMPENWEWGLAPFSRAMPPELVSFVFWPTSGLRLHGRLSFLQSFVIRSVLDRLAVLGLPLWFTELDVSAANEHVRADDLEVMLREAYAHPAVEGVMLWGFWELFMSRDDAHLVNAEGDINEAGRRLLQRHGRATTARNAQPHPPAAAGE